MGKTKEELLVLGLLRESNVDAHIIRRLYYCMHKAVYGTPSNAADIAEVLELISEAKGFPIETGVADYAKRHP